MTWWTRGLLLAVPLLGLPVLGVRLAGFPMDRYFEFPPRSQYVQHAAFSWPVFVAVAAGEVIALAVFLRLWASGARARGARLKSRISSLGFPLWGWLGLAFGAAAWVLAWNRFPWFAPLQAHTFTPLWLSYMVVVNALTFRREGRCLLTHRTGFFLRLFPVSAVFWWFFEYLNRYVQNWRYLGAEQFSHLEYFVFATLSFSTVLPAVMSTFEWMGARDVPAASDAGSLQRHFPAMRSAIVIVSAAGLLLVGVFPSQLFPLLWLAPLGLLVGLQSLENISARVPTLGTLLRLALAALVCGFFWEMWNWHSLAKWVYDVPYVTRFKIFEMPLLGYFGYLPFGWECGIVAAIVGGRKEQEQEQEWEQE